MGKKYTTFLTLFTVICITLTGCERENEQTANQGRLNLKLAVDTNVENMVTRATADEETLPDINDFSIAVLQNNNVQLTWNRYADFTDGTEIAAGNYTLKATYGNIETQGFEAPYYEGAKEFSINKERKYKHIGHMLSCQCKSYDRIHGTFQKIFYRLHRKHTPCRQYGHLVRQE